MSISRKVVEKKYAEWKTVAVSRMVVPFSNLIEFIKISQITVIIILVRAMRNYHDVVVNTCKIPSVIDFTEKSSIERMVR